MEIEAKQKSKKDEAVAYQCDTKEINDIRQGSEQGYATNLRD